MKRTRAREIALQALYQFDLALKAGHRDVSPRDYDEFVANSTRDAQTADYARRLIELVILELDEIDRIIGGTVEHWNLGRLASIDRTILRMAVAELLYVEDVPPKVVIDEAIELAKRYSTEQSGAFVNGVLDKIYHSLEHTRRSRQS